MTIKHFSTAPAPNIKLLFTLIKPHSFYQKTVEWRELFCYKITKVLAPIYHKLCKPSVSKWSITNKQISQYPNGSLGKAWSDFYKRNNFSIYPNYEEHDLAHVILGFKTTTIEEARMIFFMFGAGKRSAPTLVTMLFGLFIFPELTKLFYKDYKQGKKAVDFTKWDFRYLLNEDLCTIRQMILKKHIKETTIIL